MKSVDTLTSALQNAQRVIGHTALTKRHAYRWYKQHALHTLTNECEAADLCGLNEALCTLAETALFPRAQASSCMITDLSGNHMAILA